MSVYTLVCLCLRGMCVFVRIFICAVEAYTAFGSLVAVTAKPLLYVAAVESDLTSGIFPPPSLCTCLNLLRPCARVLKCPYE